MRAGGHEKQLWRRIRHWGRSGNGSMIGCAARSGWKITSTPSPRSSCQACSKELRVLPLSTESSLRTASFVILSFGGSGPGALDDVVSTEGVESEMYYPGETYTYHHGLVFQALVEESLPPAESRNLILETAERVWAN